MAHKNCGKKDEFIPLIAPCFYSNKINYIPPRKLLKKRYSNDQSPVSSCIRLAHRTGVESCWGKHYIITNGLRGRQEASSSSTPTTDRLTRSNYKFSRGTL